jgi:hypothetical protein
MAGKRNAKGKRCQNKDRAEMAQITSQMKKLQRMQREVDK